MSGYLNRGVGAMLCAGALLTASAAPAAATPMPAPSLNFLGLGATNSPSVQTGDPPDPIGAVGPNNYVQAVNGGFEVWDKQGRVVSAAKLLRSLWTGYVGSNAGNACSSHNDGDPIVRYDRQADRWLIAQQSVPHPTTNGGPSFECVAVSKTGDPAGAYWLYDFKFPYGVPSDLKVGVWPGGYYATFNAFDTSGFKGVDVCGWDRAAMLSGQAASQQCQLLAYPSNPPACPAVQPFTAFGVLPATTDGSLSPPNGSPEYLMQLDQSQCSGPYNQLDVWQYHVDWATPGNSTLSGPTAITVDDFTPPCPNSATPNCIPQGTTTTIDAVSDTLMDRLVYRNMGDHQSLLLNHTIKAGAGAGIRWYELRMRSGAVGATPTVYQQGTVAPNDTNWRWMGSLAQDQAGDIALGYSISSPGSPGVVYPSIAWTGRLGTDTGSLGAMTQTEAIVDTGTANAPNDYGISPGRARWGDYSSMTVDPSDDCTFWYTNEVYKTTAFLGWDTYVASVKFPNCAANDFSIASPASVSAVQGGAGGTTTISTAQAAGTAETIALNAWDLPPGVTASFSPSSVTTGASSTLKLTAAPSTPLGTYTVQVAGSAPSAVHGTSVSFTVISGHTLTTTKAGSGSGRVISGPAGIDCGSTCAYAFASGTPVTLTATPAAGSRFVGWAGGGCAGTGTCQLTMLANETITATFRLKPPNTQITATNIQPAKHKATFAFKAIGRATGLQCALVKKPQTRPSFSRCRSPKIYKSLARGTYVFQVRAFNAGGPDPMPAKKRFTIN